nr:uncharacterized protein LOC106623136 isoform X2 [Bactrocera oleae]
MLPHFKYTLAICTKPTCVTVNEGVTRISAAIEDWELPKRYARKPIDQIEMEYINNGGTI